MYSTSSGGSGEWDYIILYCTIISYYVHDGRTIMTPLLPTPLARFFFFCMTLSCCCHDLPGQHEQE